MADKVTYTPIVEPTHQVMGSEHGDVHVENGRVVATNTETGEFSTIPLAKAQQAFASGKWKPTNPETVQALKDSAESAKHSGTGSVIQTGAEALARGAAAIPIMALSALPESLGGVPEGMAWPSAGDVIENSNKLLREHGIGSSEYNPDDVRARAIANPMADAVGGFAGELALFGGASRLAAMGAGALGLGTAAAEVGGSTALASEAASGAMRSSFLRRLGTQVAKEGSIGAVQGGLTAAGAESSAAYRERRGIDGDALLSQVGMGAMLGFGLGAGLGAVGEVARTGASALRSRVLSAADSAEAGVASAAKGITAKGATDLGYGVGILGKVASRIPGAGSAMGMATQVGGTALNLVFRKTGREIAARRALIAESVKASESAAMRVESSMALRAKHAADLEDLAAGVGATRPEFAASAAKLESAQGALTKFEADVPRRIESMARKHATDRAALEESVALAQKELKDLNDNTLFLSGPKDSDVTKLAGAKRRLLKAETKLSAELSRQNNARKFFETSKLPELRAKLRDRVEAVSTKRAAQERTIRSKIASAEQETVAAQEAQRIAHERIDEGMKGAIHGPVEQTLNKVLEPGAKAGKFLSESRRQVNREFSSLMAGTQAKPRKPPSVELDEHIENGRKDFNRAIAHAFKTLGGETRGYKPVSGAGDYEHFPQMQFRAAGESPRDAFIRRSQEVSMRAQDILGASDSISSSASGVERYAPEVAMKMRDSASKALVLLDQNMKPTGGSVDPFRRGDVGAISSTDIAQAERTWNAVMWPGQFLDEIAQWSLTQETAKVAGTVYPDMVREVSEQVAEKIADGWEPSRRQRQQLTMLLGVRTVESSPEYQARFQGYVQVANQGLSGGGGSAPPARKPGSTGSPSIAQSYRTTAQNIESSYGGK